MVTYVSDSVTGYIPTPPDGGWGWLIVLRHLSITWLWRHRLHLRSFFIEFQEHFKSGKAKTSLVGSLLAGFYLMSGEHAYIHTRTDTYIHTRNFQNIGLTIPGNWSFEIRWISCENMT